MQWHIYMLSDDVWAVVVPRWNCPNWVHYGWERGVWVWAWKYVIRKWCGMVVYVVHLYLLYMCIVLVPFVAGIVWQCVHTCMWPELTGFSGLAASVVVVLWLCGLAIIGRFSLRFSQSILVSVQSILLPFLLPSPLHWMPCDHYNVGGFLLVLWLTWLCWCGFPGCNL